MAARIYACLAGVIILFQIALAAGAPWGHLANGGLYPGRMPAPMRALALVQGGILAAMAWAVLAHAKGAAPGWVIWAALGVTFATTIANWITPSAPERRLWGPVTLVMLVASGIVAAGL